MKTTVAFALALTVAFTGIVGNHAEAAKAKPDLIVSAVSAPPSTSPGATIVVSGTIKNQGKASSKAFSVAYYLSPSASSTSGAAVLGTQNVSGLAAGASVALSNSFTVPASTTSGTFYVVGVADSTKVISESNESNNARASGGIVIQSAASTPVSDNQITVWVTDALTRIQPTDPTGTTAAAAIKAARNEYETFQVIVRAPDTTDLSGVNVTISDLVGLGTIAKSNIALYRTHYIPVTAKSQFSSNGWYSPNQPGDWPDALVPSSVPGGTYQSFPFSVQAGKNQPVLVEVFVPKESPAGTYTGTLTITATGQSPVTMPIILTVWGFTLPDKPALASDFWGYDLWMTTNYSYSAGADRLTLRNNLYTDLRRHRIGFGLTDSTGPFPNASLDAVLQQQARIQSPWNMTDVNLQELVGAYGADQLFGQHYDEPQTVSQINAINDPNGEVQRYRRNGVPELLTVSWSSELINGEYAGWSANVDIFAGVHYALIPFSNAQKKLNEGKAVWSYSAGMQPNEAPTWLLDYNLVHFRMVPWLDYSTGLTGFLYWTPVNWCGGDPWTNSGIPGSGCESNRNMDGVFYFPGDKVGAPNAAIPSARLKAIRDGVEDYDYLALLANLGDPILAKSLAKALAPAFDSWNHDPAAVVAAREQAAARIVALGGN
ncbi:hypothetical protein MELA_00863 [Candidatus Methylomirabilis lanthanidiphila]|uniref:Glycoside hydrolase 123 C-terminal domain-containing protein n=1 Tax=Candidatus Methylomirabilis lanthanidiphila TaxID=2211376 RepID=A0A564ZGN6_9BACT|nr:DUF4091 domain-containing protein [Candidatus Methylomirabilis lanthanidiphila]VUZ84490.1 hypothetical protein MELA_00863 [Candidatus Methylomirabilis lanthanidiphila]